MDWRSLPIGPVEAYILSRVDGATSENDIIGATGVEPQGVKQALERLAAQRTLPVAEQLLGLAVGQHDAARRVGHHDRIGQQLDQRAEGHAPGRAVLEQ